MPKFDIAAKSLMNAGKRKNGDSFLSDKIIAKDAEYLFTAVADGVSSSPRDYLASETVCKEIFSLLKNSGRIDASSIESAVFRTNRLLLKGVDGTLGMQSTLTLLVVNFASDKAWSVNIGDSRLFGVSGNVVNQLSSDDSKSIPEFENGKLKMHEGLPVFATGLIKTMGDTLLDISVSEYLISDFDGFVLATDGFYSLAGFDHSMNILLNEPDMSKSLELFFRENTNRFKDDATVILLRPGVDTVVPVDQIADIINSNINSLLSNLE